MTEVLLRQPSLLWCFLLTTGLLTLAVLLDRVLREANPRYRVWLCRVTSCGVIVIALAACLPRWAKYDVRLDIDVANLVIDSRQITSSTTLLPNPKNGLAPPITNTPTNERVDHSGMPDGVLAEAHPESAWGFPAPIRVPPSEGSIGRPRGHHDSASIRQHHEPSNQAFLSPKAIALFLLGAYLAGTTLLVVRWVGGVLRGKHLVQASANASSFLQAQSDQLADRLGTDRPVVRVSDNIASPCVVGWRSPTILLPSWPFVAHTDCRDQDMLTREPNGDRDAACRYDPALHHALAHELAHLASGDVSWSPVMRSLSIALWPNPLVWRLSIQHRDACEEVADLVAADLVGDRVAYRESLARVALRVGGFSCPMVKTRLAMARTASVVRRLRRLAQSTTAGKLTRRWHVVAVVSLLSALAVGGISPHFQSATAQPPSSVTEAPTDEPTEPPMRSYPVRIVAADDGEPIDKARLVIGQGRGRGDLTLRTDSDGNADIPLRGDENEASVWAIVYADGLVPQLIRQSGISTNVTLKRQTTRLDRGRKVSGIVIDQSDEPVKGADVSLDLLVPGHNNLSFAAYQQTTGPDGRFEMAAVPADGRISIRHEQYLDFRSMVKPDRDAAYQLAKGRVIEGSIIDPDQQPVGNAKLYAGIASYPPSVSAADGSFRIENVDSDHCDLFVIADGFVPLTQSIEAGEDDQSLRVKLSKGEPVEITVVDQSGDPISDARITIHHDELLFPVWSGRSNLQGKAVWRGGGSDLQSRIRVSKDNFVSANQTVGSERSLRFELEPIKTIRAEVVDAQTGQPVQRFWYRFEADRNDRRRVISEGGEPVGDGRLQESLNFDTDGVDLVVGSQGYDQAVTALSDLQLDVPVTVSLKRSRGVSGLVLNRQGKPVSGARVILADPEAFYHVPPRFRPILTGKRAKEFFPVEAFSDANGRFRITSTQDIPAGSRISAEHADGYDQQSVADLREFGLLRLSPWSSLTVTVGRGEQPITERAVSVHYGGMSGKIRPSVPTKLLDAKGIVVFDRLIPGDVSLTISEINHEGRKRRDGTSRRVHTELQIGANEVHVDFRGVRLVGRILVPEDPSGIRQVDFSDEDIVVGRIDQAGSVSHRVHPDDRGNFVVDGLEPGRYRLAGLIQTKVREGHAGQGLRGPRFSEDFTIDEPEDDQELPATIRRDFTFAWNDLLSVGDDAYAFIGTTENDGVFSTAKMQGRWLLVDSFSDRSPKYVRQLRELKKRYPAWRAKGLQIVSVPQTLMFGGGVSGDASLVPWPILNDSERTHFVKHRYGLLDAPERVLVSPAGRVTYRGSDLHDVITAIDRGLASANDSIVSHRYPVLRSKRVQDDHRSEQSVAIAIRWTRTYPHFRPGTDEYQRFMKRGQNVFVGVRLYSQSGQLIREISLDDEPYQLPRPTLAANAQNGRLYLAAGNFLHTFDRSGKLLFRTEVPGINSLLLDSVRDELWCSIDDRNHGWTIVLDADGNEIRRLPMTTGRLVIDGKRGRVFAIDHGIRVFDRQGNLLQAVDKSPRFGHINDAEVDTRGQLWIAGVDRRDRAAGYPRGVWFLGDDGLQAISEFTDQIESETPPVGVPIALRLDVRDDRMELYVRTLRRVGQPWESHTEAVDLNGEPLGRVDTPASWIVGPSTGRWDFDGKQFVHFGTGGDTIDQFQIDNNFLSDGLSRREVVAF